MMVGRPGAVAVGCAWKVTLLQLLMALGTRVDAIPKRFSAAEVSLNSLQHSRNDVYPNVPTTLDEQALDVSLARNLSEVTDVRDFIMNFVQDERICYSKTLRQLVLGKEETDRRANIWWSKRCGVRSGKPVITPPVMSESTLIRYRRKSSNRASHKNTSDPSEKVMKRLDKLIKSKKTKCNLKKAVVALPNDEPNLVKLWPSCVYIKQCSGCCDSPYLECIPTKTKKKKFTVFAVAPTMSNGARRLGQPEMYRTVFVSEHRACDCQCKVQPEHCTSSQWYDVDACLCRCPTDTEKSCASGKVWSEKDCACVCRTVSECTTGRFFDTDSCRCVDPPVN